MSTPEILIALDKLTNKLYVIAFSSLDFQQISTCLACLCNLPACFACLPACCSPDNHLPHSFSLKGSKFNNPRCFTNVLQPIRRGD